MFAALHNPIRLESHAEGDELVTQLFAGDRELALTPSLRSAVLAFLAGTPDEAQLQLLTQTGVLSPPLTQPVPEVLQLRRRVRLEPVMVPQRVRIAGAEGPLLFEVMPDDLTVDGFVARHWLGPLQKLLTAVRAILVFKPSPAQLAAVVEAVRTDLMALGDILELEHDRLVPLVRFQQEVPAYELHLRFFGDRNPLHARNHQRFQVRITPDRFATIGAALARLEHGVHGLELKAILDKDHGGKHMVLGFMGRGMVAEIHPETSFEPGTHYLRGGSIYEHPVGLWIDPVYPVGSARDAAPPIIPRPRVQLFTRAPDDAALFRLARETPTVVAVPRGSEVLPDRTAALLSFLGFDIRVLEIGDTCAFDGVHMEHSEAGVVYTIDGLRTLVGRTAQSIPPVDRLFVQRNPALLGSSLAGLFTPLTEWTKPATASAEAIWKAAGEPAQWWCLNEESVGHSKTRRVVDLIALGPPPPTASIATPGMLRP